MHLSILLGGSPPTVMNIIITDIPPNLIFVDNEVLSKCRLEKAARPTGWCKLSIVTSVAMADYTDFPHAQQPYQDWNTLPQSGRFLQTTSPRQLFPNANNDVGSLPHGSPQAIFDSTCEKNSRVENSHFWLVLTTNNNIVSGAFLPELPADQQVVTYGMWQYIETISCSANSPQSQLRLAIVGHLHFIWCQSRFTCISTWSQLFIGLLISPKTQTRTTISRSVIR
jgi:hypothetical protein